jgi:hypothetical protein
MHWPSFSTEPNESPESQAMYLAALCALREKILHLTENSMV